MANQNHRMTPAYSNQSHRMPSASHPIKSHLFTAFLPNQPIRLTAYAFSAQSTNQKPTHTFPGQSKPLPDFCLVSSIKNPPHALPLQPNQKPPLPFQPIPCPNLETGPNITIFWYSQSLSCSRSCSCLFSCCQSRFLFLVEGKMVLPLDDGVEQLGLEGGPGSVRRKLQVHL